MFKNEVPEGWYADPAKPDMQRWWTGAEWTEHVRYSDRPQPIPFAVHEPAPVMVQMPAPETSLSLRPIEAPSYLPLERPAAIGRVPTAPIGFPESTLDRFYIPMRRFEASANDGVGSRHGAARAIGVWLAVMAVVGAGVGFAAWALLLR